MKLIKRLMTMVGILMGALVAAMLIIPFVVDVDKYRPQVVQAANQHLNGKLDLGKLTLSLWGKILVRVDGLSLSDSNGMKVVSVQNAAFHVPFSSLLTGSPLLTFRMETPELNVIKNKNGQLNILNLVKPTSPNASEAHSAGTPATPKDESAPTVALPGIVAQARLGVELLQAHLNYQDQMMGLKNEIKDLNLIIQDLSMNHAMTLKFWAQIDSKMAKVFTVKGPLKLDGVIDPKFSGTQFHEADAQLNLDADGLEITMPGLFLKDKSVPANISIHAKVSPTEAAIDRLQIHFHNAQISASAQLAHLGGEPSNPVIKAELQSNEIDLAPWSELLLPLKSYELGGVMKLKGSASGPSQQLSYNADLDIKGATAKSSVLKAKPQVDAAIHVVTDQIKDFFVSFKALGNDLKMTGSLISFARPQVHLNVDSSTLDLDQLVNFPPPSQKSAVHDKAAPEESAGLPGRPGSVASSEDLDAALAPVRENEMLRGMNAEMNIRMKGIRAYGIQIPSFVSRMTFKNLVAAIEKFDMQLFSGTIQAKSAVDLKPRMPAYSLDLKVAGLDLKQAVTSQLALFKNTVYGKVNFNAVGNGSSLNSDQAKARLVMKGNMRIQNAVFATIDIAKMVNEGLNKAMEGVASKVPALKGKTIPGKMPNKESVYDSITSDFSISGGKFTAPNFQAKAEKGKGVDLKGNTSVGLLDQSLRARWEVIDTYNTTHARDLSVDLGGQHINHILAKGNDPVSFPVTVEGTLMNPKFSYSEVPEYFAKVVLSNMTGAAKTKVQAEIKKQIMEKAPEPAKKLLEGFTKKLFH